MITKSFQTGCIYLNVLGDINYDKLVSVADAVLLCRYISEDAPEPFRDEVKYDINGYGLLIVLDVTAILRKLIPDSQNKAQ